MEVIKRKKGPVTDQGGLYKNVNPGDQLKITHQGEELIVTYRGNKGGLEEAWSFKGPLSFQIRTLHIAKG